MINKSQKSFNSKKNFQQESEYDKEILDIARVTRIVAGGRRFSFRATVAAGNKNGLIGVGVGKGKDVAQSINKAFKKAQKDMVNVDRENGTIPVDIIGKFKSTRVLLKPARRGRGLIAGGAVRALCNLAGIENISAKVLSRGNNKLNIARATLNAFQKINQFKLRLANIKKKDQIKENPTGNKQTAKKESSKSSK
jgi:small subunit ribosomal protein S5